MTHSLINLHSYLVINGAIAIGFMISRSILSLPFFRWRTSQAQKLKFARYSLFTTAISFFMIPNILAMIPSRYHSNFQFEPIIKNASVIFLKHPGIINEQIKQINSGQSFFSLNIFLMIIFLAGCGLFLAKYINSFLVLNKIRRNSFCQHKINNVSILISPATEIPFCWSLLKNHFIVIPNAFLEKPDDLNWAIRHELQHIRQGDTYWLPFLIFIKSFCFWNPFINLWITWLNELQEFSCDEAIVLRKKTLPTAYAQCLINIASDTLKSGKLPQGALGIHGLSTSILYRRINMLLNYKKVKMKKISIIFAYIISIFAAISTAYAFNGSSSMESLTSKQIATIIQQSHLDKSFQISATPEVVTEINNIRSSAHARTFMHESLQRMKRYQPIIEESLKKESMPNDLLVVPLIESGYQPLEQSKNPVHAAGIWQFIPTTAEHFGLIVNDKRDDRMDTKLSTKAALNYLRQTHNQFGDWKLAFIAYEIGEENTAQLIKETKSHDAWVLARSPSAPESLKKSIAMFDAAMIIMHNPSLITNHD